MFGWKTCGIATMLVAALSGCGGDEPDSVEIGVGTIEITQAVQTAANSIDLVSDRSTTVRVQVVTDTGDAALDVDGRLHVFANGSAVTPSGGVAPINAPFDAPTSATWDRDQEGHTLVFELAAPTGIPASNDVDFEVVLDTQPGESDTSDNTGRVDDLTVVERLSPQLFFTRINYTPAGAGLPALADCEAGVGDTFVRGIYPVDDSDPDLYLEGLFPTLSWNNDPNGNGQVDADGEHSDILDWLESCRQLIVGSDGGNGDDIFLYGWVEGNPISGNGWARTGGRVGFGNTQHSRHQRTYAHELGHNFGLSHNSRTLAPDVGWDTGARLDGNPGTNNTTGRVKPSTLNDVMRGGQLTDSAWVDETTYASFLGNAVLDPSGSGPDKGDRMVAGVIAISGVLTVDGRELVRLNPAFRYNWLSQASQPASSGQYVVEVVDESGDVYDTTFNGILGDDSESEIGHTFGFFAVRVAVPADRRVAVVRVRSLEDQSELGELRLSEPPTVELEDPSGGLTLEGLITLPFKVNDPDTPLEQIRVQFAYSPDGTRWVPVAVNVAGDAGSVQFDAAQIENTANTGTGRLRAMASDGLNTAIDEIGRVTVQAGRKAR